MQDREDRELSARRYVRGGVRAGSGLRFFLGAATEHTDNVFRLFDNEESATVVGAFAGFDLEKDARWITASLQGDVSYYEYLGEEFPNDVVGSLLGQLDVELMPKRFNWFTQDAFSQAVINAARPDTPDNLENINLLETGPRFGMPIGARNELKINGMYKRFDFEKSSGDSRTVEGFAAFERRIAARKWLSLNFQTAQVEYRDADVALADFDQQRTYIGFKAHGLRTDMTTEVGYVRTEEADSTEEDSGIYARVNLMRRLGARSRIELELLSDQTDISTALALQQQFEIPATATGVILNSADVFELQRVGLRHATEGPLLELYTSISRQTERYRMTTGADRDLWNAGVTGKRRFGPVWVLGLFASYWRDEYRNVSLDYSEWETGMTAEARLTTHFGALLSAYRLRRSGGQEEGAFAENMARLEIFYVLGERGFWLPGRRGRTR
jgi:hypothetical protein